MAVLQFHSHWRRPGHSPHARFPLVHHAPHTPSHTRSFLIGAWPVYGLPTPLIAAVLFAGLIMASHFIPAW
jgi:hypothetical protein